MVELGRATERGALALRGIRRLIRAIDGMTLRTFVRATLAAAVSLAALIFIVFLGLVYYPAISTLDPQTVDEYRYLDQGWGIERESSGRETYYYTPQGTSIKHLRYSWFVNLERPWAERRFADPQYMRALGFVVDPVPTHANPDLLPVGFTRHYSDTLGEDVVDITCAACHTGQLNIRRNGRTTAIRIDGGPAMHAFTAVNFGNFGPVLLGSMTATYFNPFKFNRFAHRVLGDHYAEGKARLSEEFYGVLRALVAQAVTDKRRHLYPVEEGFGRTDALGRINNVVFAEQLNPANYRVANAPVSFPALWNIWKFDWVQYTASVSQPMARNVGESMGVGADFQLVNRFGMPIPDAEQFRTSVMFDKLQRIESTLQRLKAPQWPEDLLGRIDRAKAARGQALFAMYCQGCHGPHVAPGAIRTLVSPGRTPAEPLWTLKTLDLADIGTDPTAALNFANSQIDLSRAALDPLKVGALMRRQLETQRARSVQTGYQQNPDGSYSASVISEDSVVRRVDALDLRKVSIGAALNIVGLIVRDRYYTEHKFSDAAVSCYEGFGMLDIPQGVTRYRAKPLEGAWATPPFLHNGSVPNVYELLSPAKERSRGFYVGRREFDPVKVGFVIDGVSDGFWFDTRLTGNANIGHEFRAGWVEYDEANPQVQFGVIGPELTPEQRYDIIEYLKIHRDDPSPVDHVPQDCVALEKNRP